MPLTMKASPEEFIHIFVNNSSQLMKFLQHMSTKVNIVARVIIAQHLHIMGGGVAKFNPEL